MFDPPSEFVREDADTNICLIRKNVITYGSPVDDAIFSAHQPVLIFQAENGENMTQYLSDDPGSVIGCMEQVSQFASHYIRIY